jgi:hypothetical protein
VTVHIFEPNIKVRNDLLDKTAYRISHRNVVGAVLNYRGTSYDIIYFELVDHNMKQIPFVIFTTENIINPNDDIKVS